MQSEEQYVFEHRKTWQQFSDLCDLAKKSPAARKKLRDLYPVIAGQHSFARDTFPEKKVTSELGKLIFRARSVLDVPVTAGEPRKSFYKRLTHYYLNTLPALVARNKAAFFLGFFLFWGGSVFSFILASYSPEFASSFIGSENYHHYRQQIEAGHKFQNFFIPVQVGPVVVIQVMLNNLRVSIMTAAGGLLFGIGTLYVTLVNSFLVGGLSSLYYHSDYLLDFWTQIFQHGTLELTAIAFASMAGFMIAFPFFYSGQYRRFDLLKRKAMEALHILGLVALMLVIAGLIEGMITPLHLPIAARFIVIGLSFIAIAGFLYRVFKR